MYVLSLYQYILVYIMFVQVYTLYVLRYCICRCGDAELILDCLSMDGAEVASVGRRLVRVAKAIVPDWNEVCVWSV